MSTDIAALLQPMKDRLTAATPGPWEVVDFHEGFKRMDPLHGVVNVDPRKPVVPADKQLTVQIEDGELADAEFIAAAPTDQAKLIAAIEAVVNLPHEDYCCTKGCPGFGLATCGKVFKNGDECDGSECSCFMSSSLRAIRDALEEVEP